MRIVVIVAAIVVAASSNPVAQDPLAYCAELFPDSYSLRLACVENEREARTALHDLTGPELAPDGHVHLLRTDAAAAICAQPRDGEQTPVLEWTGDDWGVETYAEARCRLQEHQLMRCVPGDQGTRQCVVLDSNRTVATFHIRAGEQ